MRILGTLVVVWVGFGFLVVTSRGDEPLKVPPTYVGSVDHPRNTPSPATLRAIRRRSEERPGERESALCCETTVTTYPSCEGFESELGDWVNATGDDLDWTRWTGSTPSFGTGPDSAYEGSYYLYTEATEHSKETAILEGPCFDLTLLSCPALSFSYHMYGSEMGTLSVEVSDDWCITWTTVWTESGDQGAVWHQAQVNLSAYSGSTITIRFVGVTANGYRSDMTIDHVCIDSAEVNLTEAEPECNDSLALTQSNCLHLAFDGPITNPEPGQIEVCELLSDPVGECGDNLSEEFTFTVEDGDVLKIVENGGVFSNGTWYCVRNTGGWPCVNDFKVDYRVVRGDANNDGRVNAFDANDIWSRRGEDVLDCTTPYDIDGDGRINAFDVSHAWAYRAWKLPPKPDGHECTLP